MFPFVITETMRMCVGSDCFGNDNFRYFEPSSKMLISTWLASSILNSGTHIQCPPLILAPSINMSKGCCENKSALFILLIFHSNNSQNSSLSLK